MNDYLGKLAAKELKCAENLEPRPASLFEPMLPSCEPSPPSLESPAEHQSPDEVTSTVFSHEERSVGFREASHTFGHQPSRASSAPSEPLREQRDQQPFPPPMAPTSSRSPAKDSVENVAHEPAPRLPASRPDVVLEQTSSNTDRTTVPGVDSVHETSTESVSDAIASGNNAGPASPSQFGNREPALETTQAFPTRGRSVLTESQSTVTPEQITRVAPGNTVRYPAGQTGPPGRMKPSDAFPEPNAESIVRDAPRERMLVDWPEAESSMRMPASRPPPIVRVTIGRIEVRAVTAPTTVAPREAPSKPSRNLSLDDYLRQRNERR